jgi:hypothetical protein
MPGGSVSRKTPHLFLFSTFLAQIKAQKEESGDLRRILARRTNNRNTLRHHDLVPTMRMQIP